MTRLLLVWAASHPDEYAPGGAPFLADVGLYRGYATEIVEDGQVPYADVAIEYPPGVLPFIVAPEVLGPGTASYRDWFIASMLLVDVVGLVGLVLLARRRRSSSGLWLWIGGLPLLGPLAYARLDLVPAVATIWAAERASARADFATGAALGFGALAKLYPLLLVPAALVASSRPHRLAAGAAVFLLLPLLAVAGSLDDMIRQVVTAQAGRGIHIESIWGSLLLLAERIGYPTPIASAFSTLHFEGLVPRLLRPVALVATAAAVAGGCWLLRGVRRHRRPVWTGAVMFATLAVALGVATTFSPQYVIWLAALGATAVCTRQPRPAAAAALLIPVVAATQVVYPFAYADVVAGELPALLILLARNLLVMAAGLVAFRTLARQRTRPASEQAVSRSPVSM